MPVHVPPVPAMLRLVRQSVLGRWQESAEDLYREVAGLLEADRQKEVIIVGCGEGVTAEWIASRTGAAVTGVDSDEDLIRRAELRSRALSTPLRLTYQTAALDDLPHETAVFDAGVGEPTLASAADPALAVSELARVVRPLGNVVLLQLTWNSEIGPESREMLVERLGLRPRHLVEWKQLMRDAGLVDIQVEDWTAEASPPTQTSSGEVEGDRALPRLTWQQKMHIVGRAWRRWGWKEARGALAREEGLLRELAREGVLGFRVIKGVKWPHATSA
jgi:2-polyprenyl-3-methyl-5-hydroxy-6-metoxy-1,4-benzoquinol methylase